MCVDIRGTSCVRCCSINMAVKMAPNVAKHRTMNNHDRTSIPPSLLKESLPLLFPQFISTTVFSGLRGVPRGTAGTPPAKPNPFAQQKRTQARTRQPYPMSPNASLPPASASTREGRRVPVDGDLPTDDGVAPCFLIAPVFLKFR